MELIVEEPRHSPTWESAAHAESLFLEACARHGIAPDSVHNDRGAPMKSVLFTALTTIIGARAP
jgi:hypothetical protein